MKIVNKSDVISSSSKSLGSKNCVKDHCLCKASVLMKNAIILSEDIHEDGTLGNGTTHPAGI